ncbi:MAG: SMP-30/gluconolactonase/LRE family protein [Gammaproteobacteria bacterium]|nr:MAG: SMP-30/gluconolactonase/LRE family protein [Gammaproteobacteria bacterium]
MKIINFSLTFLAASSLAIIALTGCEQKKSETATSSSSSNTAAVANNSCGASPAGDLVAQRIPGANSKRSEYSLYEGAVWIKDALYFSDFVTSGIFPSRIQKLDANGVMTTLIEDSGSNGLAVDAKGNIVAATHKFKSLSSYTLAGARTALAGEYNGNVFNSPNDLTIAKDGTIYFTDPDYQRDAAPGGQEKTSVYRVAIDGTVTVVDDTLKNPNGIALSLDEKILYVSSGDGILHAYPIENGIPQAGKNLVTGLAGPDGMTLDCHGNIYATEHMAHQVRVITPSGESIAAISVDNKITNAAFGGSQGKTLFLTGAGAVWKIELDVTGLPY